MNADHIVYSTYILYGLHMTCAYRCLYMTICMIFIYIPLYNNVFVICPYSYDWCRKAIDVSFFLKRSSKTAYRNQPVWIFM